MKTYIRSETLHEASLHLFLRRWLSFSSLNCALRIMSLSKCFWKFTLMKFKTQLLWNHSADGLFRIMYTVRAKWEGGSHPEIQS